ncbi:MAG: hypothetical protein QM628_15545 [Propionicimonas sp.]
MKMLTRNVVEEAFGQPDWDSLVDAERSCHRDKAGWRRELRKTAEHYRLQCSPDYSWDDDDAKTTITLPANDEVGKKWIDFLVHRLQRFGWRRQFHLNIPEENGASGV